jgi:hypothetical protein
LVYLKLGVLVSLKKAWSCHFCFKKYFWVTVLARQLRRYNDIAFVVLCGERNHQQHALSFLNCHCCLALSYVAFTQAIIQCTMMRPLVQQQLEKLCIGCVNIAYDKARQR